MPRQVADAIRDFMVESYVQRGAGYRLSQNVTRVVDEARQMACDLVGAGDTGAMTFGATTSSLMRMLADAYADTLREGDEIVVAEAGHEANVGPWVRLEKFGARIVWWRIDPTERRARVEDLEPLLSERTRIVAFPQVSNILGEVTDARAVADLAHQVGAEVVVDGVAFAPHASVDVQALDADWYVFSFYKVFGPHMAALYGKHEAYARLVGPNHFFVPRDAVPYKFELGAPPYELCAGLVGLRDYLRMVGGPVGSDRERFVRAFRTMLTMERPVHRHLVDRLSSWPGVRMISSSQPESVGIVSFVHERLSSQEIAEAAWAEQIGIRHGSMYSNRLISALGLDPEDGVVRVSLAHYNTVEEIDRLLAVLEPIMR